MRIGLRCYAELNECLSPERRQRQSFIDLQPGATTGDLLEEMHILPEWVELILVNARSRGLNWPLAANDLVSLYPVFEAFDVTPSLRLRNRPLREPRFLADAHLGGLARYLRLLGFDTLFENDFGDARLAEISARDHRILLTRDRALLARRCVTHGLRVPDTRPRRQIFWLVARLDLFRQLAPFTRCTCCNGRLDAVERELIAGLVPPRVLTIFDRFWRCRTCGRVYWQGSHYQRLRALVEEIRAAAPGGEGPVCPVTDPMCSPGELSVRPR